MFGTVAYDNYPPTFVPLAVRTYGILFILRPFPDIL